MLVNQDQVWKYGKQSNASKPRPSMEIWETKQCYDQGNMGNKAMLVNQDQVWKYGKQSNASKPRPSMEIWETKQC